MKHKMSPEQLEQFIHRTLRSLSERHAPGTLEARVLAAVEERAAIAWYHKTYHYWPAPVRVTFLGLAMAASGAVAVAFYALQAGVDTSAIAAEAGSRFSGLRAFVDVAAWSVGLIGRIVESIPPIWLYGGLAFVGLLYVSLFSIGAAAYRTLYRHP
jgi:hypothetical protein